MARVRNVGINPDENLRQQLVIANQVLKAVDDNEAMDSGEAIDMLCRLSLKVVALNKWLSNEGHLPIAWDR